MSIYIIAVKKMNSFLMNKGLTQVAPTILNNKIKLSKGSYLIETIDTIKTIWKSITYAMLLAIWQF